MFLHFCDLYQKAHSKHVSLDVLAPNNDAIALEGLRELTLRRDQAIGRECMKLETSNLAFHADRWVELGNGHTMPPLLTQSTRLCPAASASTSACWPSCCAR